MKTTQFRAPRYVGDPVDAVRAFNGTEADALVLLDITASHSRGLFGHKATVGPDLDLIARISEESTVPIACGGGVRTLDDVRELLRRGVEKVLVNTRAVEDPSFVRRAAGVFGGRCIAASIDAKRMPDGRYEVFSHGGYHPSGVDPVRHAKRMESMGAGEIFLNSVDRDGTMKGYDLPLIRAVAGAVKIPVTACGGAGRVEDFGAAIRAGAAAAASGLFVFPSGHRTVRVCYPTSSEVEMASHGAPAMAAAQGR